MEVRVAGEDSDWVKQLKNVTAEEELCRFKAEVRRVDPTLCVPARDDAELEKLDVIAIFAQEYARWHQTEGQIPYSACSTSVCPTDTMVRHAELYGMGWHIANYDEPQNRFWYLQKEPEEESDSPVIAK